VIIFARAGKDPAKDVSVCVMNLAPVVRQGYRVGLPLEGRWREALNTDSGHYGGSDVGNYGGVSSERIPWMGQPFSAEVTMPPLAVLWLVPEGDITGRTSVQP
jgi:1,4-alpha-glucan branching enzyme